MRAGALPIQRTNAPASPPLANSRINRLITPLSSTPANWRHRAAPAATATKEMAGHANALRKCATDSPSILLITQRDASARMTLAIYEAGATPSTLLWGP